jgi:hypothetical protein
MAQTSLAAILFYIMQGLAKAQLTNLEQVANCEIKNFLQQDGVLSIGRGALNALHCTFGNSAKNISPV